MTEPNISPPNAEAPRDREREGHHVVIDMGHNDALSPAALIAWAEQEAVDRQKYGEYQRDRVLISGEDRRLHEQHVAHQFLFASRLRALAALAQAAPRVGGEGEMKPPTET